MPVYHIALYKTKPDAAEARLDQFASIGKTLVGKIPGLVDLQVGPGLISTAHRAQGFNMGLVAILEEEKDIVVYMDHPEHQVLFKMRDEIFDDSMAFDMAY